MLRHALLEKVSWLFVTKVANRLSARHVICVVTLIKISHVGVARPHIVHDIHTLFYDVLLLIRRHGGGRAERQRGGKN